MSTIADIAQAVQRRIDGWVNTVTGIAMSSGRLNYQMVQRPRLSDDTLRTIYREDPFARRVVDAVPKYALREGIKIKTESPAIDAAVRSKFDDLAVSARFGRAWRWARLYGGGAVLIGADDGQTIDKPLDMTAIRSVRFLTTISRARMWPEKWSTDSNSPHFGTPETYRFSRVGGGGGTDSRVVHRSRLILFPGAMTDEDSKAENQGWDDSIIEGLYNRLQEFNGASTAVATLLQDASQGVLKIKGLADMMGADSDDRVKIRLSLMDQSRSILRALLLDADGEDFTRTETGALTGMADLISKVVLFYAGASGIPVTVLMGQAPAGLAATGDADIRMWYDDIRAEQGSELKPRLEYLAKVIFRSQDGPTQGREPASWQITFPSLWQLTDVEKATLRKTVADTDGVYIDKQVVTPEEIAVSRFPADGWSMETTIETEARALGAPVDGTQPANDTAPVAPVSVAEQAMNGAQVTSLQGIVTAAAANQLPVGTAREIIGAAFPELASDRIEKMLAPIAGQAGAVSQLADANTKLAAVSKSHASLKSTLKRLIAKYGHAGSVVGITGSGAGVSDEELDAAVAEVEGAEAADAGGAAVPTTDAVDAIRADARAVSVTIPALSPEEHRTAAVAAGRRESDLQNMHHNERGRTEGRTITRQEHERDIATAHAEHAAHSAAANGLPLPKGAKREGSGGSGPGQNHDPSNGQFA